MFEEKTQVALTFHPATQKWRWAIGATDTIETSDGVPYDTIERAAGAAIQYCNIFKGADE